RGVHRLQQAPSLVSAVTPPKRYSTLFARPQAMAHSGGWEWDTGRDRLYLTTESRRIIGRDPAPRTIDDLLDCRVDTDRAQLRQALDVAMDTGRTLDHDLPGMRPDGEPLCGRAS